MELNQLLNLYKKESREALSFLDLEAVASLTEKIIDCYHNGNKIFLLGNGGNAAYCANWATDLALHPFVSEDKDTPLQVSKRLKVFNLSSDPTTITGIVNDLGGDAIFVEQLKYLADSKDLVIGLSGSGNSPNIVKGMSYSLLKGMFTVGITRNSLGAIVRLSSLPICLTCKSEFPGQTGKNEGNFHFEDMLSKISHMTVGILKRTVRGSK